jgi:hypothetical protein
MAVEATLKLLSIHMATLQFTIPDYQIYLRMSHRKHLLVEGRDDYMAFKLLLDEYSLYKNLPSILDGIDIDTAESLIGFTQALGNREKVEAVCNIISGSPDEDKLVGFVDREFRDFEIGNNLRDVLVSHKVSNRLIWSRGHSIENYCFDFQILRAPLRDISITTFFNEALNLFQKVFESTIHLACAASLVGQESNHFTLLATTVHWSIVEIVSTGALLKLPEWQQYIQKERGLSIQDSEKLAERFQFWHSILTTSDFDLIRWLCHGHIGIKYIWAVYTRCVYEVSNKAEEANRFSQAQDKLKFNMFASSWARQSFNNSCEFPTEIFALLKLAL